MGLNLEALFSSTLIKMVELFAFIFIGYLLTKLGVVKAEATGVLSKLENTLFIPACVMGTLMGSFTIPKIHESWRLLVFSLAIAVVVIPLALLAARLCSKDPYDRHVIAYGLSFSNFGYMGIAVVGSVFPEHMGNYMIFTLVLWILIYGWAVPAWLIPKNEKQSVGQRIKSLFNPMFVGALLGIFLGLTGLHTMVPEGVERVFVSVVDTAGACMSPIAMILTGITVASIDLKRALKTWNIYVVTVLRLVIFPLLGFAAFLLLPKSIFSESFVKCAICSLAMPLGLGPVIIPAAYGKDTGKAAAMTLVSHLLSVITIPLIFILAELFCSYKFTQ